MQPDTPQASAVQGLLSSQSRLVPGTHVPAWQLSSWFESPVQGSLSLHAAPSAMARFSQPIDVSHKSVVQGLLSSQETTSPPEH
jgi:hypothetical protein